MSQESKIAQLGILNILNQMKNPLTNIRLCVDMLEEDNCTDVANCASAAGADAARIHRRLVGCNRHGDCRNDRALDHGVQQPRHATVVAPERAASA